MINDEILNKFPLMWGTSQGCTLSPFLFNITLKYLPMMTGKGNKRHKYWEKRK